GEDLFMGDVDDRSDAVAVRIGLVDREQPVADEDLQLGSDVAGQAGPICAAAGGVAIGGDRGQGQQPGEGGGGGAGRGRRGPGPGGVGLAAECAVDTVGGVVPLGGQLTATGDSGGQLVEDVGQQGQGLAAAGVGDHPGDQLVADVDAGVAGGSGDDQR